ncbi:hypothetical protein [Streptomyces sp. x-19]|uniref:hypothetical protein n=1 Tax=Streptomyces sp. x-19 TaxID=2789280 RepID=UPI00397EF8C6
MVYTFRFDVSQDDPVARELADAPAMRTGAVYQIKLPVRATGETYEMKNFWVYRICPGVIVYPGPLFGTTNEMLDFVNPAAPGDRGVNDVPRVQKYLDDMASVIELLHGNAEGRNLLYHLARVRPLQPPVDELTSAVKLMADKGYVHWSGFELSDSRTPEIGGKALLAPDGLLIMPQSHGATPSQIVVGTSSFVGGTIGAKLSQYRDPNSAPDDMLTSLQVHLEDLKKLSDGSDAKSVWDRVSGIWKYRPGEGVANMPRGAAVVISWQPRFTFRRRALEDLGSSNVMPLEVGLGHEMLHALHTLSGCRIPGEVRTLEADPALPRTVSDMLPRFTEPDKSRYFYLSTNTVRHEEMMTGTSLEGRHAALKVIGSKDLELPDVPGQPGKISVKVCNEVYSAHRSRVLMLDIAAELRRLGVPEYWDELFPRSVNDRGVGQDSLAQLAAHRRAYEKAAWKCEGHLAMGSALQAPVRFAYTEPLVESLQLREEVPIEELGRSQYRLPISEYGDVEFSSEAGRVTIRGIFTPVVDPVPISFSGPASSPVPREELEEVEPAELVCNLRAPVAVQRVDIDDPALDVVVKAQVERWRSPWGEVLADTREQSRIVAELGRELTGLPGGRGVWSTAGWAVPGSSVLSRRQLGAATRPVHDGLTQASPEEGEQPALEVWKGRFRTEAGAADLHNITLALMTYPQALQDAFAEGTPWLRRAADVLSFYPLVSAPLYALDDLVHGDYVGAAKIGAWLGGFALVDVFLGGPVAWGLAALVTFVEWAKAGWEEALAEKKAQDEIRRWLADATRETIGKLPMTLWTRVFNDTAAVLGGEALRLEAAAVHDAQVTIAAADNLMALAVQSGAGFITLEVAWDELDKAITQSKWPEDRRTLYEDWLYPADPSIWDTAGDEQKRRVYCHLSVCLYRQLKSVTAAATLKDFLDKLETPLTGDNIPPVVKDKTPGDGLRASYSAQLRIAEYLAQTLTSIAEHARTNATANLASLLVHSRAAFTAGTRRLHSITSPGSKGSKQYSTFGKYVYQDVFLYTPLNPVGDLDYQAGQDRATQRAQQRSREDFRRPRDIGLGWKSLTEGENSFQKVDAFLPDSQDPLRYAVFSGGHYREIRLGEWFELGRLAATPRLGSNIVASLSVPNTISRRYIFFRQKSGPDKFKAAKIAGQYLLRYEGDEQEVVGRNFEALRVRRWGISLAAVDAVMPSPTAGEFWFFREGEYVKLRVTDYKNTERLESGYIDSVKWPAFFAGQGDHYDRVDAVLPIPNTRDYFVFKDATYRRIRIPVSGPSQLVSGPNNINSDWHGHFSDVEAVIKGLGNAFQIIHSKGVSALTVKSAPSPAAVRGSTPIDVAHWPSLADGENAFASVDAVLPVPDSTDFIVFSNDKYRRIRDAQTCITGSTAISATWTSLTSGDRPFPSVDAVLPTGAAREYYIFSGEYFRRIRIDSNLTNTLIVGSTRIDAAPTWSDLHQAGLKTVDAFLPVPQRPGYYTVFSGERTLDVAPAPGPEGDILGLTCWSVQDALLTSVAQTGVLELEVSIPVTWTKTGYTNVPLKNAETNPLVGDIRSALKALWNPGTWSFKTTAFGRSDGNLDTTKLKRELSKYFSNSPRTALLTPTESGELPRQLAQDTTDILATQDPDQQKQLRDQRATDAVNRLTTRLQALRDALAEALRLGAEADQDDDQHSQERVTQWSAFHDELSRAWSSIYSAIDSLTDPDVGQPATALGSQLMDAMHQLKGESTDIRAKRAAASEPFPTSA